MSSVDTQTAEAVVELIPSSAAGRTGEHARVRPSRVKLLGEQAFVLAGQMVAGLSHLAFAVVAVRILSPDEFSAFAAFQALYLIVRAAVSSLIAGGALDPGWSHRTRERVARHGVAIGAAGIAGSILVGRVVDLSAALVVLLALSVPSAGLFALDQGRLYGSLRHARAVGGQVAGPLLRMGIGIPLAMTADATGAALATVLGGYFSVLIVRPRATERRRLAGSAPPTSTVEAVSSDGPGSADAGRGARVGVTTTIGAFLLLALIQSQDVMLANRILDGHEAGRFAALSTLAGAVAFATATVPFVLLPRARHGNGALGPALLVSGTLGLVPALVVAVAPETVLRIVVGERYIDAAPWAGQYVLAIALLGIARVLIATLCARDRWRRPVFAIVTAAAAIQVSGIIGTADNAREVANCTLVATAFLAGAPLLLVTAGARRRTATAPAANATQPLMTVTEPAAHPEAPAPPVDDTTGGGERHSTPRRPDADAGDLGREDGATTRVRYATGAVMLGFILVGLVIRILTAGRSVWVDEAISITQAQLPFREMLKELGNGDVHPPLHNSILWVIARVVGTDDLAMRIPSIAAGTLMIPMIYLTAKALFDRRVALVAAGLGVVSPFMVWYSQEARMYGLLMLFGLCAVWAQVRVLQNAGRWYWVAYAVASAAMMWAHYLACVPIAAQQLIFIHAWWRRRGSSAAWQLVRRWSASAAGALLLAAPLVPFLLHQLETNKAVGRIAGAAAVQQAGTTLDDQLTIYRAGANIIWALWGFHTDDAMTRIAALWPLLMLLGLFLLGRGWSRRESILATLIIAPPVAFGVIGYWRDNLFEIRYFSTIVAPLLILIGAWIVRSTRTRVGLLIATSLVTATMVAGLLDQQVNRENPRVYDFDGALTEIEDMIRPGDRFIYAPQFLSTVVRYYSPDTPSVSIQRAKLQIPEGQRVIVLGGFLDLPHVSARIGGVLEKLGERGTRVETIEKGTSLRIWVYE